MLVTSTIETILTAYNSKQDKRYHHLPKRYLNSIAVIQG